MPDDSEDDRDAVKRFANDLTASDDEHTFCYLRGDQEKIGQGHSWDIDFSRFVDSLPEEFEGDDTLRLSALNRFWTDIPGSVAPFCSLEKAYQWLYDHLADYTVFRRMFELCRGTAVSLVRLIFEKYAYEGYGAQRIATYLNQHGYRARTGKPWHHATIRGMLCNLTYTGVLRSGESRSQLIPELQIISQELYDTAQEIRTGRSKEQLTVPRNTKGRSLLAGNIYCAHCGARLCATTNTKKNSKGVDVVRLRYVCYGKTRKQTECDGQTGYLMEKIDEAVDHLVREIFQRMQGISRKEIVQGRYQTRLEEQKALMLAAQKDCDKCKEDLDALKAEVIKAIQGNSSFPKDLLADMVTQQEEKYSSLCAHLKEIQQAYEQGSETLAALEKQFDNLISLAEMYDSATMEARKMIVGRMVTRVEVGRDYKINICFRREFQEFFAATAQPVA